MSATHDLVQRTKSALRTGNLIARYRLKILYKKMRTWIANPSYDAPLPDSPPPVTIFITNINNRSPLELTLRSLTRHTQYPNYQIVVADNGSTDGSVELVRKLIDRGWPIRLIENSEPCPQHEWYDRMSYEVETPYWVGLHEDMMLIGDHWLEDLIAYMESHPDVYLLGGEYFPPREGYVEPVSKEVVDLRESLSTWIFCARTSMRDHVDTSFAFTKHWSDAKERTICYDQGGKLMADLRARGLGVAHMPDSYKLKYQHVSNISWAFKHDMPDHVRWFKTYQLADVRRRAQAARRVTRASSSRAFTTEPRGD